MPETLRALLESHFDRIAKRYVGLMRASSKHYSATSPEELERNVRRSLQLMGTLYRNPDDEEAARYIRSLCEQRVPRGFRLGEVMHAIFLLEEVLTPIIRDELREDQERLWEAEDQMRAGLNRLALLWSEGYFDLQEQLLARKERAMRALSTPVIQVWHGILTLPLIGDVDEERSRQITEDLLQAIIDTQSSVALIDITGIGSIDTNIIAQLIRTVRAAELLGAECWVVGVSPAVANTIVNLGVDLGAMTTYGTLQQGLDHAFQHLGFRVCNKPDEPA